MEILAAYDLVESFRGAGALTNTSHHTVARLVRARDAGQDVYAPARRPKVTDVWVPHIEQWIRESEGNVRGDVVHGKLVAMGYAGSERSTRRAVSEIRADYRKGKRRVHKPWVTEPGGWVQYDFGDGPLIDGIKTVLFIAWVAWSRFRVVIPLRDKTLPSVFAALDRTFRLVGGVPTYVLTDNEKTVTTMHIAGVPVRNEHMVAFSSHYGVTVLTCAPADPPVMQSRSQPNLQQTLLILDEAHLLTHDQLEELRLLTNAEMDSHSPFAGLLVGQPSLRRKIELGTFAALDQRISLRYAFEPMTAEETSSYIHHHLSLAGRKDVLFSDDAIEVIHQVGRGTPRAVNNLAIHALVATYSARKGIVDDNAARVAITEVMAE